MGENKEKDLYRETPIRYLGYANEIGEAFRTTIGSRWVAATYGVATMYVLADTIDKTRKSYMVNDGHPDQMKKTLFASIDCFIWQMLASVAIPGYTINRVCFGCGSLLKKMSKFGPKQQKMIVTAIGLGTIPFIIKPIDHFTDRLLDLTLRRFQP
nr:mitochondrial fission process protein 1 isoform X3 [Onthophagus taurus]